MIGMKGSIQMLHFGSIVLDYVKEYIKYLGFNLDEYMTQETGIKIPAD